MYSPAQAIGKYCRKDCVVKGYKLHQGHAVVVRLSSLHKNEKYWCGFIFVYYML